MSARLSAHRWAMGALVLFAGASIATAHDFWVQPSDFWLTPDAVASMTLQVGHGESRQRSPIALRRITRFEALAPSGRAIDLRAELDPGGASQDGEFRLVAPGAYVLVLETDEAYSRLPADRFNEYLQAEGLTAALEHRRRMHRMSEEGIERYSRRAKSLVHVGAPNAELDAQVTRPLGLALEIVPDVSPYVDRTGSRFPVRVIYEGRPLAQALVKLTDLENDELPVEAHRTDSDGRATFVVPDRGAWLLNVVWSRPLPNAADAEFETIFSSLVFGFP
jgi:uncharacterized GH25 family protein